MPDNIGAQTIKQQFVDFIERKQGHYVVYLSSTQTQDKFTKTFYINNLTNFNSANGTFTSVRTISSELNASQYTTKGLLINNSLQNTLTFDITTQEVSMEYELDDKNIDDTNN